jgi:hypothetical protein
VGTVINIRATMNHQCRICTVKRGTTVKWHYPARVPHFRNPARRRVAAGTPPISSLVIKPSELKIMRKKRSEESKTTCEKRRFGREGHTGRGVVPTVKTRGNDRSNKLLTLRMHEPYSTPLPPPRTPSGVEFGNRDSASLLHVATNTKSNKTSRDEPNPYSSSFNSCQGCDRTAYRH